MEEEMQRIQELSGKIHDIADMSIAMNDTNHLDSYEEILRLAKELVRLSEDALECPF